MINHFFSSLDFVKRKNLSVSFADSSPKGEPFEPPFPLFIHSPPEDTILLKIPPKHRAGKKKYTQYSLSKQRKERNPNMKQDPIPFVHAGGKKNLRTSDIVGIFDMDSATVAGTTRKFLSAEEKAGRIEIITEELPKSFILSCPPMRAFREKTKEKVFLSQLAPQTLSQRSEALFEN